MPKTKLTGRPPKYNESIIKRVDEYLQLCEDQEIDIPDSKTGYRIRVKLPSVEGLALFLKVHRDTLYEWAKTHDAFSDTLERIKQEQAERLINNGLSGDYNSTIVKLMLSSNHGMREKTDVTTDGKSLPNPIYGGSSVQNPGHDGDQEDI